MLTLWPIELELEEAFVAAGSWKLQQRGVFKQNPQILFGNEIQLQYIELSVWNGIACELLEESNKLKEWVELLMLSSNVNADRIWSEPLLCYERSENDTFAYAGIQK